MKDVVEVFIVVGEELFILNLWCLMYWVDLKEMWVLFDWFFFIVMQMIGMICVYFDYYDDLIGEELVVVVIVEQLCCVGYDVCFVVQIVVVLLELEVMIFVIFVFMVLFVIWLLFLQYWILIGFFMEDLCWIRGELFDED